MANTTATGPGPLPTAFESIIDRLPLAYAWIDADLTLRLWNPALPRLLGVPSDAVSPGQRLARLLAAPSGRDRLASAALLKRVTAPIATCLDAAACDEELTLADGRTLLVRGQPGGSGDALVTLTDITALRRTEARLRESEERYDCAMLAIAEGAYDWDLATGAVFYSAQVREFLGFSPGELRTADDWGSRIHPDDLPHFRAAYVAHVKGDSHRFSCDYRYRPPKGGWRWARQHGIALRGSDGRAIRMVGSTGDITELKQAEIEVQRAHQALAEQNARLRSEIDAHRRARATIEYLVDELRGDPGEGRLVGRSAAYREMMAQIELVAVTDATVLLLGETGTGKELAARAIHEQSHRHARPLVKVNCAALPRELVESELFGHEKGAFTGATQLRRGRFELADGGTLLLDEVGDLPLEAQAKLLRVLQSQEFERVGGSRSMRTDVRLIAATHRDLEAEVAAGAFRADLFYRLNVFPVRLPPLRERREDIPSLIEHLARRAGRRIGKSIDRIDPRFVAEAMATEWPGNIRQLENGVERAVILSRDGILSTFDAAPGAGIPTAPPEAGGNALPALDAVIRDHIARALERSGGLIEGARGAARVLGLKPSTLRSRMRRLGLARSGRA